ncbi:UNVERIFIED_CONTAM: AMP-activated serine/threonine-protein kinase regulatory subunit, partial [Siphonaria sp. JEL0065]
SRILLEHHLYRLPLVDDSQNAEVIVSVVTEFKILRYIAENCADNPLARKSLRELGLGTYKNVKTATADTPLITVLNMFVKDKISAVPIQDENGEEGIKWVKGWRLEVGEFCGSDLRFYYAAP